jgi:hypothetical protein
LHGTGAAQPAVMQEASAAGAFTAPGMEKNNPSRIAAAKADSRFMIGSLGFAGSMRPGQ